MNTYKLGYHITPTKNVKPILSSGLNASKSGLDGPGIYIYKGSLELAIKEACISIQDSLYSDDITEHLKTLSVLEVKYKEKDVIVEWEEYIVLGIDKITKENITNKGDFITILDKYYPINK